jgi:hypothetical protein
MKRTKYTWHN